MDSKQLNTMLDVIDGRVRKIVNEEKPTFRNIAQITGIDPANPNFPQVKLAGYTGENDESFSCYNASSSALSVGDWVYLLSNGHDLNTAIIIGERNKNISQEYFVTPQMYGAKADGETDDTVAVQTALDSGVPVFFPDGVYLVKNLYPSNHGLRIQGTAKQTTYTQPYTGSIIRFTGNLPDDDTNALFSRIKVYTEIALTADNVANGYITIDNLYKPLKVEIGSKSYDIEAYSTPTPTSTICSYRDIIGRIYFNDSANFVTGNTVKVTYLSTISASGSQVEGIRFENGLYGKADADDYGNPQEGTSTEVKLFNMGFGGNFKFNTTMNFNDIFQRTGTAHITNNYFMNIRGAFGFNIVDTTVAGNYINGTTDLGCAWTPSVVSFQMASSMFNGNYIDYFRTFMPKENYLGLTTNIVLTQEDLKTYSGSIKYLSFSNNIIEFKRVYVNGQRFKVIELTNPTNPSSELAGLPSKSCAVSYNTNDIGNWDSNIKYAKIYFKQDDLSINTEFEIEYNYANARFLTANTIVNNNFDEMYQIFQVVNNQSNTVTGNTFSKISGTEYNNEFSNRPRLKMSGLAYAPWEVCSFSRTAVNNFILTNNTIFNVNRLVDTTTIWTTEEPNGWKYRCSERINGFKCENNTGSYLSYSMNGYVPNHTNTVFDQRSFPSSTLVGIGNWYNENNKISANNITSDGNKKYVNFLGEGVTRGGITVTSPQIAIIEANRMYCHELWIKTWESTIYHEGYTYIKYKYTTDEPVVGKTFTIDSIVEEGVNNKAKFIFAGNDNNIVADMKIVIPYYIINYDYTVSNPEAEYDKQKVELVYNEDTYEGIMSSSNLLLTYLCTNASDTPLGVTWSNDGTNIITGTLATVSATVGEYYFINDVQLVNNTPVTATYAYVPFTVESTTDWKLIDNVADGDKLFNPEVYKTPQLIKTGDFILNNPKIFITSGDDTYQYSSTDDGSAYFCRLDRETNILIFHSVQTGVTTGSSVKFTYYLNSNRKPIRFYIESDKIISNKSPFDCNDVTIDLLNNINVPETFLLSTWNNPVAGNAGVMKDTFPLQKVICNGDYYINMPLYGQFESITGSVWKKLTGGGASTPMRVRSNDDWITLNVSTE